MGMPYLTDMLRSVPAGIIIRVMTNSVLCIPIPTGRLEWNMANRSVWEIENMN
jgi:hypothetical protein